MEIHKIVNAIAEEVSQDSLIQQVGKTESVHTVDDVSDVMAASEASVKQRNKSLFRVQKHEAMQQANIQAMVIGSDVPLLEQFQTGVLQKIVNACNPQATVNQAALHEMGKKALRENARPVVKYLIENGWDINYIDGTGKTALVQIVEEGRLESVKILLEYRPGLEIARPGDGFTPLLISLTQPRNPEIARALIEAGANVNAQGQGLTALQKAISNGDIFVATLMLSRGAQLNIGCENSNSPLILAFKCNPPGIERDNFMRALIHAGANVDYRVANQETALFHAVRLRDKDAVKFLCSQNASVDLRSSSGKTAIEIAVEIGATDLADIMRIYSKQPELDKQLCDAVQRRDRNLVIRLIQIGAQIDTLVDRFSTPLQKVFLDGDMAFARFLVQQGASVQKANLPTVCELLEGQKYPQPQFLQMATFLFDFGSDVNQLDAVGRPLLSVSAMMGNADLVDLLIARGVKVEPGVLVDGMTPLLYGAHFDNRRIVEALLRANANVNALDKNGHCVLTKVLHKKNLPLAHHILTYKPILNITGDDGCNPLEVAVTLGDQSLVEKMIQQGANVNYVNSKGWTPLMCAIKANAPLGIIKLLLDSGAKPNVKTKTGESPMSLAIQIGRQDIVNLLLERGANNEPITTEPTKPTPISGLPIGRLIFG